MSKKDITELLQGLDTVRPIVLESKNNDPKIRRLLRNMLSSLERLESTPMVSPSLYKKVLGMLSTLFDVEHGTLLKRMHDVDTVGSAWNDFDQHLKERKLLIDTALQDFPLISNLFDRGCDLLDKPRFKHESLSNQCIMFERYLVDHLQGNSKVRHEFNLMTSALKGSVAAMSDVLDEVGTDSPELHQVQAILERDLPDDPVDAQLLLQEARVNILKAGEKLSRASEQVKQTITEQIQQMSSLSERLEHAESEARNDPLTGLGNRRKLSEFFTALPEDITATFLMLDIDHFKRINDKYGHDSGDKVLEDLALLLKSSVRTTDMVARMGGEEFCIILPKVDIDQGIGLAENIRKTVRTFEFKIKQGKIRMSISIGVAERLLGETTKSWFERADQALYHAKENGRNRVSTTKDLEPEILKDNEG